MYQSTELESGQQEDESHEQIVADIITFIVENDPIAKESLPFPRDESLYEKGILDSMGVIELVTFIEKRWTIEVLNEEITVERFGSLNKMARLIREKQTAMPGDG